MKKWPFLLLACLITGQGFLSLLSGATTIIESNPNRITVKYTPPPPQIRELMTPVRNYQLIWLPDCATTDSAGELMLPVHKITVAIPDNATITPHLVNSSAEKLENLNCPPVPTRFTHAINANSGEIQYIEDPLHFLHNAFFPASVFQVSEPAWLRHQKVVEISFFPVQVNPVTQETRFFSEIILELNFETSVTQITSAPEPLFEPVYEQSLLNFRQSTNWRGTPVILKKFPGQILSGMWFKLKINETGFYRIDRNFLEKNGVATEIALDQIQLFNGGGQELSIDLNDPEPEFREVALEQVDQNQNNRFDENDFLLFFAQGTTRWKESATFSAARHFRHSYTDENVYWLRFNIEPGKRLELQKPVLAKNLFMPVQAVWGRIFAEQEKWLMRNSGTVWIWDEFRQYNTREYQFSVDAPLADSSMVLNLHFFGNSSVHNLIDLRLNEQRLQTLDLPYTLSQTFQLPVAEQILPGENRLKMTVTQPNSDLFFDWLEVHYWRNLDAGENQLEFSSSGYSGRVEFQISNISTPEISVYELTDPFAVKKMQVSFDSSRSQISVFDSIRTGEVHSYQVIHADHFRTPAGLEAFEMTREEDLRQVSNQANYLIITADTLLGPEIEKLAAHRADPRYWPHAEPAHIKIVSVSQIYNQFARGLTDPVAIRNFLKFAFENWEIPPVYVLFVGDANYDYKNHYHLNQPLLVPSYSAGEKLTDDWFAYLTRDRKLDLITGRLPVKNREELEIVVNKIIQYDNPPTGSWANQILMLADDDYQKQSYTPTDANFILDSEAILQAHPTDFDISKIYLKYFPWDRSFNKPGAKAAFIEKINSGVLFINYLGHASWNVLSHEGLFDVFTDFSALKNAERLPLFFAGTCEVSLFDDPHLVSLGERFILKENGGVIALVASARWNVHHASQLLNEYFYQDIFSASGKSFGEILTAGKTKVGFPDQMELVFLFGDPAQQLRLPSHQIQFEISPDTLDLHHRLTLSGQISNEGSLFEAFDGSCEIKIYDSAFQTKYYEKPVVRPGSLIFEGNVAVNSGQFRTDFFLQPEQINGGKNGQIRLSAWETSGGEFFAQGKRDSLAVKFDSLGHTSRQDTLPPVASFFFNANPVSLSGNLPVMGPNFTFSVQITDSASGIFHEANSGWEMQLRLDQDPVPDFSVTTHFQVASPHSQTGRVDYEFKNMPAGLHTLEFFVWDNALNPANFSIPFRVAPQKLSISNLLCYPNPATTKTWFTFISTHEIVYWLKVYTVAGRLIREFEGIGTIDFNSIPADGWDLRDETGDRLANGVYFYKLTVNKLETINFDAGNQSVSEIGKVIILR